jgi:hypothetical protein
MMRGIYNPSIFIKAPRTFASYARMRTSNIGTVTVLVYLFSSSMTAGAIEVVDVVTWW